MGRRPGKNLRYWRSLGGYFVTINGIRTQLARGPDTPELRAEAERELHGHLARQHTLKAGDRQPCYGVLEEYAQFVKANRKPATFEVKAYYLQLFIEEYGDVPVRDLTPQHLERLILKYKEPHEVFVGKGHKQRRVCSWGPASRQACVASLHGAFAWAAGRRIISANPLRGMEQHMSRSRGREALVSEADHQRLLAAAPPAMGDLLVALNDTGARPGAVYRVEAADLKELADGVCAWVGTEVKRERYGFPAIVYLTPRLVEMHRRLAALWPEGPIFRNRRGRPWTDTAVEMWFGRARRRLALNPKICPYSYRHKFATEWLLAGKPIAYLAELQNTSVRMIERHYGHLREHGPALHKSLLEFRGAGSP